MIKYSLIISRRSILISLFFVLLCHSAFTQFYPSKTYTISDGLPSNSIYDITQSTDGMMWFVSSKGVVNYNSIHWTLMSDSLELPSSPFSIIKSCVDSTIWVAGQNSKKFVIKYYDEEKWTNVQIDELSDIEAGFSFDVKRQKNGYLILIAYGKTLFTFDTDSKQVKEIDLPEAKRAKINAAKFRKGEIYICASTGLFIYDKVIRESPITDLLTEGKEVLQIYWKNDKMYLLGIQWLASAQAGKLNFVCKNTGITRPSSYNRHNLAIDQLNRIFYSSSSGAMYFDQTSLSAKKLDVNGSDFNIQSNRIYIDTENNVWVGDHRGLFKFNLLRFQNYNENTNLAQGEVSVIFQNNNDVILANTRHLNFLKQGSVEKSIWLGNKFGLRVMDIAKSTNGDIFIASHSGGLLKYDKLSGIEQVWATFLKETSVSSVELFNDTIYFSSNKAIYKWSENGAEKRIDISGIRNIQSLNKDSLVLLSTSEGMTFYDRKTNKVTTYRSEDREYNNVFSLTRWRDKYYLATIRGLATIENGKIIPLNISEKLNKVATYSFLTDKNDNLWIGSNEGVFIWDGSSLVNYNKGDGLVGNEVNRNALIADSTGQIWIGTELGASVYDLDKDLSAKLRPILNFREIRSQRGTIINDAEYTLASNDNTVEFNFLGISYFDEERLTYRYKLNGFDNDWIYGDNPNANSVRYTNLPSGRYEFSVQTGISGNNWSEPKTMNLVIKPPYYKKWWFVVLILILSLVLLSVVYRIRFYLTIKRQKKLQILVQLRTNEIEGKNKEIKDQNKRLKVQSEEISTINEKLEDIVQERTKQLKEQNDKLIQYAFFNSHELRAPICRILGLMNLLKLTEAEEHERILFMLQETGVELDIISKEINHLLDNVDLEDLHESMSIQKLNSGMGDLTDSKLSDKG